MTFSDLLETLVDFITTKKVYGPIIAIVVGIITYKLFISLLNKIVLKDSTELSKKRAKTIIELFQNVGKYVLVITVCIIILEIYGINTSSIIAGLGIAGVVLGLALQDTLKDIIGGVTIIFDNYYIVGDHVEYKGFTGEIISIGLRSTKAKKESGEVLTIANRNIADIINYSQKTANVDFHITLDNVIKLKQVEAHIEKLLVECETVKNVLPKTARYLGITEYTETKSKYTIRISCKQDRRWEVQRQVNRIIKSSYEKFGDKSE